jgi:hypothetical protein
LAILLVTLIGGIFSILITIEDSQKPFVENFGADPTTAIMTNQSVGTHLSATSTAKVFTPTPTK